MEFVKKRFAVFAIAAGMVFIIVALLLLLFPPEPASTYAVAPQAGREPYRYCGENTFRSGDVNAASLNSLLHLPYLTLGEKAAIIEYRELLGGYRSLEELCYIKGIGYAKLEHIAVYLYIEPPETEK